MVGHLDIPYHLRFLKRRCRFGPTSPALHTRSHGRHSPTASFPRILVFQRPINLRGHCRTRADTASKKGTPHDPHLTISVRHSWVLAAPQQVCLAQCRMALPLLSGAPSPPVTLPLCSSAGARVCDVLWEKNRKRKSDSGGGFRGSPPLHVRAAGKRSGEGADAGREVGGGYTGSAMEVTTFDQSFGDPDFPVWDKIGAVVRMSYGIGIYGAMTLAGRFICSIAGIDCMGGFEPSFDVVLNGLGYATPPIMALLLILDDEVVKLSPHARAIRDVEDEELRSFFYGMSPWQFLLIVTASSVGEELFYRAAVQGALSDIFLRGTNLVTDARGMVSLTGVLPPFVPFAQAFAAVITATLTGSLYFVAASPTDPTYVIAPVLQSRSGRDDLKKLFAAWYERRQMRKIYSPLLEGLLALYLGIEWIQTDNILAPIITHGTYSVVILGNRLWKIHHHRKRLRQRIQKLNSERKASA